MSGALKAAVAAGLKRGGTLEDQYSAAITAFLSEVGEDHAGLDRAIATVFVRCVSESDPISVAEARRMIVSKLIPMNPDKVE